MIRKLVLFFVLAAFVNIAYSQAKFTMADAFLKGRTLYSPASLRQLQWIPGTETFSYTADPNLIRVKADGLKADTLNLLEMLNSRLVSLGQSAITMLPPLTWMDAQTLRFSIGPTLFRYKLDKNSQLEKLSTLPANAENTDYHPTTLHAAFTNKDTLAVLLSNGQLQFVAASEADGLVYGKSVHREEFGISKGTFWSLSGRYLAFYRMDERPVTQYAIYDLDSMPAQVHKIRYPYAGSQSHYVTVGIHDIQNPGRLVYLQTGEPAEQYLTNIAWTPDDNFILVAVVNRAQDRMQLKQFDAKTGAYVKTLFEETASTWVEPEEPPVFLPNSNTDFVWQSERNGFNHLYLYNLDGKLLQQISSGNAPVTHFIGFSSNNKACFYQMADSTGLNRFTYTNTLYSNQKPVLLTPRPGTHTTLVNTVGDWAVDVFSSHTTPRMVSVFPVKKLEKQTAFFTAPNPLTNLAMGEIRLVNLTSDDGSRLNARLILPVDFNANQKYPALVYVYNGPHVQMVTDTWMYGSDFWMHRMAQLGFAIFVLDGRGSANRGHAFESAIFRHAGDAEIADQLTGARYLKSLPFIDSTRLGVYGWSYGGFMATSLMTRPEAKGVFKAGIAGGPVIDWRMYEIMYTERYMDKPQENPDGYSKSSLFNYIDNLNGRLLMIHGSSDDVVLWQHSLRYIRECVRRGKQIDYFVYPEHKHNVAGRDRIHLFEKIEQFFKDQLLTKTTP